MDRVVATCSAAGRRWRSLWFPPVPISRLGVFRIIVMLYLTVELLTERGLLTRRAAVDESFYEPVGFIDFFHLPRLGTEASRFLWGCLFAAVLLALVGLLSRLALWLVAFLYLYWSGLAVSYGAAVSQQSALAIALFVLALSPAGAVHSLDSWRARAHGNDREIEDELAGWAFRVLAVLMCCLYAFGAYAKLSTAGADWWSGGALEAGIGRFGTPFARWLALHHLGLANGLALGALVFEACAVVLLFNTRLRPCYIAAAFLFNLGLLILLGLNFMGWAVVCTAMLRLERIPTALAHRLDRGGRCQKKYARTARLASAATAGGPRKRDRDRAWGVPACLGSSTLPRDASGLDR